MKSASFLFSATLLILISFTQACTNATSTFNNGNSSQFKHYVGEFFGGGIVSAVWMMNGVEHGLITSLYDLSEGQRWSNLDTSSIGLAAQSPIHGNLNTAAIIEQKGVSSSAAGICSNYSNDGYDDWYLPSKGEMIQLYNSALIINIILDADENPSTIGFEFENQPYYWTSTEYFNEKSWLQNFFVGTTYNDFKNAAYRVRAVRRF